ncbi:MAG: hypothetical protein EBU80_11370, partial [Chitinophagia bacterium]|nr:hypothetical protein [Chitinophagia bacterium]
MLIIPLTSNKNLGLFVAIPILPLLLILNLSVLLVFIIMFPKLEIFDVIIALVANKNDVFKLLALILLLVVINPRDVIRNLSKPFVLKIISLLVEVVIFKFELLLKIVVFIVPN